MSARLGSHRNTSLSEGLEACQHGRCAGSTYNVMILLDRHLVDAHPAAIWVGRVVIEPIPVGIINMPIVVGQVCSHIKE